MGAGKGVFSEGFASRLRQMRAALGLSQAEISRAVGDYRTDTWSRLERGAAAGISVDMLLDLATWSYEHGISLNWLLGGTGPMWLEDRPGLSTAESSPVTQIAAEVQEFSRRIERLIPATPSEKKAAGGLRIKRGRAPRGRPFAVRRMIESGYEVCQAEVLPNRWRGDWVPILGKIAAGAGLDTVAAEQYPAGLADKFVRWHWTCDKPFAVEVCGDSMEPDYLERDIVICDGERRVTGGVCCVIFEDQGERLVRLKRLALARGKVHLESLNRKYPPAILSPEKLVAAHEIIEHLPFLKDLPARRR